MTYRISKKDKILKGTIHLTTSKSESNRVLIIQALCKQPFKINNLAKAKDTKTLQELLQLAKTDKNALLDVGPAGTTMRFLVAFLAISEGNYQLTGSKRMQERPIEILVEALNNLGASIQYLNQQGFPPLQIKGKKIEGKAISVDGSISSQYITALLLIAPCLPSGLDLTLEGEVASRPYVEMTLKIMHYFGVKAFWKGSTISIPNQEYIGKDYTIEADWSAASYWFEMAALADDVALTITGLNRESLQGDAAICNMMHSFGVQTQFTDSGIVLTKYKDFKLAEFKQDFSDCPDIAQTIAVTAGALNVNANLTGLASLKIKETDRILALSQELSKMNVVASEAVENTLHVQPSLNINKMPGAIKTYEDHRMAMAFAPLALVLDHIDIEHPEVVEKSYPAFWDDLRLVGFDVVSL
jgi:3-phosphoshikimate 1-carboxyvinyltransferase